MTSMCSTSSLFFSLILDAHVLIRSSHSSLPHAIPTSRAAWREVRDHTDREAECRQAFVEAMQETVIRVFGDIVKEQGRIRLRIKEDLKMATDVSLTMRILVGSLVLASMEKRLMLARVCFMIDVQ